MRRSRPHFTTSSAIDSRRSAIKACSSWAAGTWCTTCTPYACGRHPVDPFDWAVRFETAARRLIVSGEHGPLVDYESLGRDAVLSVPTPDHYLPLLYVLGSQRKGEKVTFPVEGVDGGSISMLGVQAG